MQVVGSAMRWPVYLARVNDWNLASGPKLACQGMAGPTAEAVGMESSRARPGACCGRNAVEAASSQGPIGEASAVLQVCLVPLLAVSHPTRQFVGWGLGSGSPRHVPQWAASAVL
jgi:hypothetical protein